MEGAKMIEVHLKRDMHELNFDIIPKWRVYAVLQL